MRAINPSLIALFALALLGSPLPAAANDDAGFRWMDYDANGDGRLSRDEIQAARGDRGDARQERRDDRRQQRLDRFDTDGDGSLSRDERGAARDARARVRQRR